MKIENVDDVNIRRRKRNQVGKVHATMNVGK